MKKILLVLVVMMMCLGFVSTGFSADVAKIGTFDIQRILDESSAGKILTKQLRAKYTELENRLKTEKKQLDEMKKALEREALVLSAEKSDEKRRAYRIRVNDFKKLQNDVSREFKITDNQFKNKLIKEILEVVREIGKEEGFLMILNEKQAGVYFRQDHLDITAKIIKKYNLKVSKAK